MMSKEEKNIFHLFCPRLHYIHIHTSISFVVDAQNFPAAYTFVCQALVSTTQPPQSQCKHEQAHGTYLLTDYSRLQTTPTDTYPCILAAEHITLVYSLSGLEYFVTQSDEVIRRICSENLIILQQGNKEEEEDDFASRTALL
jgi:hypothetical protein